MQPSKTWVFRKPLCKSLFRNKSIVLYVSLTFCKLHLTLVAYKYVCVVFDGTLAKSSHYHSNIRSSLTIILGLLKT